MVQRGSNLRYSTLQIIQRFFSFIVIITVLALAYLFARSAGYDISIRELPQLFIAETAIPPKQVAIISGHAGFDSGAVCTDAAGNVTVTEAEINARIAQLVVDKLSSSATLINTTMLDEKDDRLTDLKADVMLSLHSDSCIELSGYKAAFDPETQIAETQQKLMACINNRYPNATNLSYHATTITHDMLGYHAFGRIDPQTPAAILEMGFMGGDQQLLTTQPDAVAQGIADSLLCFLNNELWPTEVAPDDTSPSQEETEQN